MGNMTEIRGSCLVIHLPEELDHPASDQVRKEAERVMRKEYIKTIEFDFSCTRFMDSSGVGLIMGRYRALGMGRNCIKAVHVSSYIEKLLHLSGIHKFMEISREVEKTEKK